MITFEKEFFVARNRCRAVFTFNNARSAFTDPPFCFIHVWNIPFIDKFVLFCVQYDTVSVRKIEEVDTSFDSLISITP